jgi:Amt family ammonium transporter
VRFRYSSLASSGAGAALTIDHGDTAWVLAASALVLFMTLPGLALFYAGLVRVKNTLSVMLHCVAIACLVSVLWVAVGYSLAFAGQGPFLGGLSRAFLAGMTRNSTHGAIPEAAFVAFQLTFAIITPALIVGAYVERIRFGAVLLFSGLWLLLVYAPVAHWIWGGGWLARLGVMDFAGGLVVHATAGVSALVLALVLGPRDGFPRDLHPPHNPGMTMMGAGMLWVGWYGFNGGSALAADGSAAMALLATHVAASTAGLVWALLERIRFGRSSMVGVVTGVVAGLATITPASGFVGLAGAQARGAAGSLVCFFAVDLVKNRLKIDDSLDVFAVHGVGGMLGTFLAAFFTASELGGVGYAAGMNLPLQLRAQLLGIVAAALWSAAVTWGLGKVLGAAVGLRVLPDEEEEGLDLAVHGERAYDNG